jgi:hypothetical protein
MQKGSLLSQETPIAGDSFLTERSHPMKTARYVFIRKVLKITKEILVIVVLLLTIAIKLKLIG